MEEKIKSEASSDQEQEAQADTKEELTSPDAAQEENQAEESEDEVGSEDSKDEIDFKAELEEKEKRLKQAEHTIIQLKKDKKDEADVEDNKPDQEDVSELIDKKVDEKVAKARKELVQDTIDEIIERSSDNPDERKFIKFYYDNRITPTGLTRQAIQEDVEEAKLLANKKKVLRENSELRIALKNQTSMPNTSQGTNQDRKEPDNTDEQFSAKELELLQRRAKGDPKKFKELKQKAIENKSQVAAPPVA